MPAALQLGIVMGLSALEYQVQIETDKADSARQVHDSINQLLQDKYRLSALSDAKTLLSMALGSPIFGQEQSSIYKQFTLLKKLLRNNPKDLQIVQRCESSSLQGMAILQQLKEMHDQGDIQDRLERRPLVAHLRRLMQEIVSLDLIDLGNHESEIADQGPLVQRHLRDQARWLIAIGGLFNFAAYLAPGSISHAQSGPAPGAHCGQHREPDPT